MRIILRSLSAVLLLSTGTVGSPELENVARREIVTDDLDAWLARAQRLSPEALKSCPQSCSSTSNTTSRAEWFLFPDTNKLRSCNETMLLDMVVPTSEQEQGDKEMIMRACSADYGDGVQPVFTPDNQKASLCTTANRVIEQASVRMHQPQIENNKGFSVNHVLSAMQQILNHLAVQTPSCTRSAMEFAYAQSAAVGLFAGSEVHQHGVSTDILKKLIEYTQKSAITKTTVIQLCGSEKRGADYSLGIVLTSAQNLPFVKDTIKTWSKSDCVSGVGVGAEWIKVDLRVPTPITSNNSTNSTTAMSSKLSSKIEARSRLSIRADCKTSTVQSGDGCWAVANRCGISQTDLEKYNRANLCNTLVKDETVCCSSGTLPNTLPAGNADGTCKTREVVYGDDCGTLAAKCGITSADFMKANTKTNLCSSLLEGQIVCCSDGKRPDLKPKQNANGNCAAYTTKKGDNCAKIAVARDLTVEDIEGFNKQTWGWSGCNSLWPEYNMCVSTGAPPMPANVPNAVCGPTMNGTTQPPAGTDLATLNPCPLNVCCNIWGQCGMTDDFCVISKSETGAPGTSAPGKNGCISNCGRDIIKGSAPASKIKVAYYESWNFGRKCLNMFVDEIDTSAYTHIHFAFANVTRGDYKIEITDPSAKEQFDTFKSMTGVKRIISLGGWAFSTEPGTFSILREAVQPANRDKFKSSIISFLNEHNLDGIDLDWEYPGAPDIPEIPTDDPVNGLNYYRLLSSVKTAVGSSKSVSFAAPASYWYLRSFPIKNMAKDLDYIVYMTYDLHGQWDYGNKWTSPGCESGNCLRSHVNETETKDALSMITKAGAASNKVVVGVASYGRSFKMAQAGCDSEECLFTGSARVSNAAKGRCTDTGGYISNAEIQEIIDTGSVTKQYKKEGSNILIYNQTEWVAYMDDDLKKSRSEFYDSYNFAGTTDWAVDLQSFTNGNGAGDDADEGYVDLSYWTPCTGSYSTLQQLEDRKDSIPAHCLERYLLDVQVNTMQDALNKYKDLIDKGYDGKFSIYEKYVKAQIPEQINNFMASDKVDKYFKCTEEKLATCCKDCHYGCSDDCVKGSTCKSGRGTFDMAKCPKMEFEVTGFGGDNIPNATFVLKDSKGFYDDILATFGIEESWIRYDRRHMRTNNGCQYSGEDVKKCMDKNDNWWYNYPQPNSDKVQIYNPKKIIGDSYPKSIELLSRLKIMQNTGPYDELTQASDLVDASSLPAYSTEEAVASMAKIVEKADEIKKKEREEFILNFITGLLFFIPIGGEVAGAAGLTAARSLLRLIGVAGDAGMAIYEVVQDPKNAFMTVFSYLAGAGVGRGGFRNAANARRGMGSKEYNSLGNVKVKLDKVESIRGIMCKR